MRIQIIMPKQLLEELDVYCTSNGYTRSEFIRNCVRSEIASVGGISLTGDKPDESIIPKVPPLIIKNAFKIDTDPISLVNPLKIKPIPKKVDHKIAKLKQTLSSIEGMCKHGSAFGNCKFGCR